MAGEVKYPVQRTLRLTKDTDKKLVAYAFQLGVPPAVAGRRLIEQALGTFDGSYTVKVRTGNGEEKLARSSTAEGIND